MEPGDNRAIVAHSGLLSRGVWRGGGAGGGCGASALGGSVVPAGADWCGASGGQRCPRVGGWAAAVREGAVRGGGVREVVPTDVCGVMEYTPVPWLPKAASLKLHP